MGRLITYNQYLNMLSEKTLDNSRQLKRDLHQRRNGMEDLYGICFSANGDASSPAAFYISLSPDYVYLERFAFKFVLKPFSSSVAGVDGGSITIGSTKLTVSGDASDDYVIDGTSTLSSESEAGSITPNPHTHEVSGSIGGLSYGVKRISTASKKWTIKIHGVDVTPYLCEQQDVETLFGDGMNKVYPNNSLTDIEDFYDILDVASVMMAEGETTKAQTLLKPEFKKVEISSDAPFGIDAYLYLKYSHLNR